MREHSYVVIFGSGFVNYKCLKCERVFPNKHYVRLHIRDDHKIHKTVLVEGRI